MPFFLLKPTLLGQVCVNDLLTTAECNGIIERGEIGLSPGRTEDRRDDIRKSDIAWFSPDGDERWLFERVSECVNDINGKYFGYNLTGFEGIQFTKYSADLVKGGGYYGSHKDSKLLPGGTIRKLSFTIQLCDAASYSGGDVVLYDSFTDRVSLSKTAGSITFFPSYTIHEVLPVTGGTRYSLVGWACGPTFV